jgi:hypothetical protein
MVAEVYPTYRIPFGLLLSLAGAFISGRRRSFRDDSIRLLSVLHPPLLVLSQARMPQGSPVVVTVNHYSRKGFSAVWVAAAVSGSIPCEVYWTMTAALMMAGKLYEVLSRMVIRRMAEVYGFNLMPPMPPQPHEAHQRSQAVRQMVEHLKANPQAVVGFAPEGRDIPGGVLVWPPAGAGRLVAQLAGMGVQFLPCALYEQAGRLIICYGQCYTLDMPVGLAKDEIDHHASQKVMSAIAELLPGHMRAEFKPPEK